MSQNLDTFFVEIHFIYIEILLIQFYFRIMLIIFIFYKQLTSIDVFYIDIFRLFKIDKIQQTNYYFSELCMQVKVYPTYDCICVFH